MSVCRIGAFCPSTQTHVELEFKSIAEAKFHNPSLRDFRYLGATKK